MGAGTRPPARTHAEKIRERNKRKLLDRPAHVAAAQSKVDKLSRDEVVAAIKAAVTDGVQLGTLEDRPIESFGDATMRSTLVGIWAAQALNVTVPPEAAETAHAEPVEVSVPVEPEPDGNPSTTA